MFDKQASKRVSDKSLVFKRIKKRKCKLCSNKINTVDYKDVEFLKNYITERGKIIPRRVNGNCAKHQRIITKVIKKAREVGFLPFQAE